MAKTTTEDMYQMRCEKVVNESWSRASLHFDEIKKVVEKGKVSTEDDEILLLIAAGAFLQKMTLDRAIDQTCFDLPEK